MTNDERMTKSEAPRPSGYSGQAARGDTPVSSLDIRPWSFFRHSSLVIRHSGDSVMHTTRRDFLKSATLIALAPTVPAFLARTARAAKPDRDGRLLVVVQLDGGNDGINTVVPFADEGYAKYRQALRLPKDRLVKVNATVGLHPSLGGFGKLLEAG